MSTSGGGRPPGDFRPLFIPVAYSMFHDSGTWPSVRAVHRRLVKERGLAVTLRDVLEFFRYRSGAHDPDAPARLNVDDIRLLPEAERDLKHVVSVVSLAVKAYWESESPVVTSTEAIELLGLTALEVRRVYELLLAEYWLWRGSTTNGDGSEWRLQVGDDIHLLQDIKTINAFLAKKAEILGEVQSVDALTQPEGKGHQSATERDHRAVFMVRGRNDAAADALQDFLSAIGIRVISWSEAHSDATKRTGMASPYVLEIVRSGIDMAQAVLVLMTPDDEVRLMDQFVDENDDSETSGQARPNVVLELGMAIALYPQRTLLVSMGRLRSISDLGGIYQTRLDNSAAKRQFLHDRLRDCGCDVHMQGRWKEAGDFAGALSTLRDSSLAKPLPSPVPGASVANEDAVGFIVTPDTTGEDKPGILDILADGESAFERVVNVLEQASLIMTDTTALAVASTAELEAVDAKNAGLRARLAVVVRHTQALTPLADRFDELSQTYIAEWRDIQSAIEYLVQQIESTQEARDAAVETKFPSSVSMFVSSVVEGADKLSELASTLEETGALAKVLRPVTTRMATAARRWAQPVPVAKDWQARLARLGL